MKTYYLLVSFSTLLFFFQSPAQQLKWVDISGIQGCYLLSEGGDGKLFAVSEPAVYFSTDNGDNWALSSLDRGVMIDFTSRNNHALVSRYITNQVERYRIEYSSDNGVTWGVISGNRLSLNYYDCLLSGEGDIYAFSSSGPLRLVHYGGGVWDTIQNSSLMSYNYSYTSSIDNADNLYVAAYAVNSNALLVSTDKGISWGKHLENLGAELLGTGPDGTVLAGRSRRTSPPSEGFVYRTTDKGASWEYLGLNDLEIYSLAADAEGNAYASTESGVFARPVNSSAWEFIGPSPEGLDALLITSRGAIYTSAGLCKSVQCYYPSQNVTPIFRSEDGGRFWSPSGPRKQDLFCVLKMSNGGIMAGTLGNRLFKTESGGLGWGQAPPGMIGDYIYDLKEINGYLFAASDEGLFRSDDFGGSWLNVTENHLAGSVFAATEGSDNKIFIGTIFGIYSSTDNGESWTGNASPKTPVMFLTHGIAGRLYAVTDRGMIYSSADDGGSWNYAGLTREDAQAIEANDAGDIFVGVYGGVMRSTDGGATWSGFPVGPSYVYSISVSRSQDIFAGTYSGIYQSRNNGANWTFIGLNTGVVLDMEFDDTQSMIAAVHQNGVYRSEKPILEAKLISDELPDASRLHPNYPNPFNPFTTINFSLKNSGRLKITVYSTLGQALATIIDEEKEAGSYSIQWNGSQFSSGLYFYRMEFENVVVDSRKMLLLK